MKNIKYVIMLIFISSYVFATQKPNTAVIPMPGGGQNGKQIIATLEDIGKIVIPFIQDLQKTAQEKGVDHLAASLSQSQTGDKTADKGKGAETKISPVTSSTALDDAAIMKLLDTVNPVLSKFGKDHNLPVDQLLQYAHCLNNFHIPPDIMAAFSKQVHNQPSTQPTTHETTVYQNIQQNTPSQYDELILTVFKTVVEGATKGNPLAEGLINGLNAQVEDKNTSIAKRHLIIGFESFVIVAILAYYAYSIYYQVDHGSGGGLNMTHPNGTL